MGFYKITFGELEAGRLGIYSCEDADFTWRLVNKLSEELKAKKVEYENSESAVYEEKESLRYTPVKL